MNEYAFFVAGSVFGCGCTLLSVAILARIYKATSKPVDDCEPRLENKPRISRTMWGDD